MMVVNAALFQDMVPAGTGGSKSGTGSADPQGSGFARILNGRVDREGAATQADAKGEAAQQNAPLKGDRPGQPTQDAEPVLVSVKELTARAEAQQAQGGEAAEAAPAPTAHGSAAQGGALLPANGKPPAAPQQQANQETAAEPVQLPAFQANANPAAAVSPAKATPEMILPQQVLAQDAAAPRQDGTEAAGASRSHVPHHGRKKGGEDAVSGGSNKTAGGAQGEQDAPVSLADLLAAGASMVTAASADAASALIPAASDETAGIPATAATVISQQQPVTAGAGEAATAVKAETVPQHPAQGVQSAELQALQQKALKFAAAQDEAAGKFLHQGAQQAGPSGEQADPRQLAAQPVAGTTAVGEPSGAQAVKQGGQGFIATQVAGVPFKTAEAVSAKAGEETAGTATAKTAGTPDIPVKPVTAPKQEAAELRQQEQPKGGQEAQAPKQSQNPAAVKNAVVTPAPAETATAQAEQGAPEQGGRPDPSTVAADRKVGASAEAGHAAANATKIVAEPAAPNQKSASTEISGTKTASAALFQRAAAQGNPGQNASGDAGEKGHPEQQGQNQSQQPATAGMLQFTAAREASQPAAAPSSAQSALHESILSQVKEAVVTHDGKWNGEMSIKLNPGELGELKIQVRMDDNRVRVEVQADNKMVKDLLLSNLDNLKDALAGKNFAMDGFDVSTGSGGGFNSPLPQQREALQQQAMARPAGSSAYSAPEESPVNYMTAEVNNLLDVRF